MEILRKKDVIESVSADKVWNEEKRTEEKCMSPFIKDVISDIAEIIGSEGLDFIEEEYAINPEAGKFRADLLYKDDTTNELVVIENQLGTTNHDHLGKCITYLANVQAKTFVWISEHFRPEHIKAIETLNEITNDGYRFYALELHLEKTKKGNVTYYYFKKIAGATGVSKMAGKVRQQSSENCEKIEYWRAFFEDLEKRIKISSFNTQNTYHQIAKAGPIVALFKFFFRNDDVEIELNSPKGIEKDKLKTIAEYLNKQYGYKFERFYGMKDQNEKWHYIIPQAKDLDKIKDICIKINEALENYNLQ